MVSMSGALATRSEWLLALWSWRIVLVNWFGTMVGWQICTGLMHRPGSWLSCSCIIHVSLLSRVRTWMEHIKCAEPCFNITRCLSEYPIYSACTLGARTLRIGSCNRLPMNRNFPMVPMVRYTCAQKQNASPAKNSRETRHFLDHWP